MKNKLLISTALAALAFTATSASAAEYKEYAAGSVIEADDLGHGSGDTRISFMGDASLEQDVTMGNFVTLQEKTQLTGDKKLTVQGYLTQTADGSDISGIDLEIQKAEVKNNSGQTVTEGELVLGNNLKVGNVNMTDGTGIWLNTPSAEHTLTAAAEKEIVFAGNNYIKGKEGSTITFDGDGSVVNNGNLVSNADIKLLTDVTNNGTIKADISSTNAYGAGTVNMASAASKIDGSIDGANLYFQDTHSLKDAVSGDINAFQVMVSNGGSLTADKTFTANDLVIGSKEGRSGTGSLTLKSDVNVSGAKVNQGSSLDLGDNKLNVSGNQFQNHNAARFMDGSTLAFNYGTGQIIGDANLEGTVTLKPTIALGTEDGSHEFVTGEVTKNDWTANDSTFDETKAKWTGYENNSLYDISITEDNKTMKIAKRDQTEMASALGANSNQSGAAFAIVSGGEADGNTAFNQIAGEINTLLQGDASEKAAGLRKLDQLSADTSSFAQSTTIANTAHIMNTVATRLSGGFSAGSQGMSSGDNSTDNGALWARGIVNKTKLDKKVNGFDADSNGLAAGAEKQITEASKIGVGYAYTNTDIDSDSRSADVDTHTAFVYGEYKPSNWYVNGLATYSWGDYDENASLKKASYDVNSFGLQAMSGYDMRLNNFNLTPEAGLRYVNVEQKAYTDSLGNRISANKSDVLTGIVGVKASQDIALDNGMTLRPEARAAMTYDLVNDDANSVVTLANGAAYTVEGEALERFGVEVGAGLTADVNDNVELSLGYEGKFREDYTDHTGLFNAKYKF